MSHSIKISCDKDELIKVRQFTSDILEGYEVPDLQAHKMVLAVDEVCANIVIHSNECNPSHIIELEIQYSDNEISFTFRDKGIMFDINQYEAPSMEDIVTSRRKGGLGLMLVKRIMDKIEFSTANNHNICRLVKVYP